MADLTFLTKPIFWLLAFTSAFDSQSQTVMAKLRHNPSSPEYISNARELIGRGEDQAQFLSDLRLLTFNNRSHPVGKTLQEIQLLQSQTNKLPTVDRVKVISLGNREEVEPKRGYATPGTHHPFPFLSQIEVKGQQAEEVANLWRQLSFRSDSALCHEPPYALRFSAKGKVLLETSVCWHCENFYVKNSDGKPQIYGFDANDKSGQTLFTQLQKLLPRK